MLLTGPFPVSGREELDCPPRPHRQLHQMPFCESAQAWASLEKSFRGSLTESLHATAKLLARSRTRMTQMENEVKVTVQDPAAQPNPPNRSSLF